MVIKLENTVDENMLNHLIEMYNQCPVDESVHIYLNTHGGSEDDMNAIINIINESEKIDVVFCYGQVASAGFVIAMRSLKPVEFLDSCVGMMHKAAFYGGKWTEDLKVHKDVKDVMKLHSKNAKRTTEEFIELGIFTDKETKKLRKGKDVWFNTNRLREMRAIIWQPIQEQIDKYLESLAEAEQEGVTKEEPEVKTTTTKSNKKKVKEDLVEPK